MTAIEIMALADAFADAEAAYRLNPSDETEYVAAAARAALEEAVNMTSCFGGL